MDKNGYNPSILQYDLDKCYLCGSWACKLDRHEIFHADVKGKQRAKSKALGLWVMLCHDSCHEYGKFAVHRNKDVDRMLKQEAQQRAMDYYGINIEEWIAELGKNYL